MSIQLLYRHVLEDHISGFDTHINANHMVVARRPVIFSIVAHAGHEVAVAEALMFAPDIAPRFCGPSEWLAISQTVSTETVAGVLSGIAGASFMDQSDGCVVMSISGPDVRTILAKCVAVDLARQVFAEGQSANMLCCHVTVNVGRTGADTFEFILPRSFAGSVFDELIELGREHGLTRAFGA